MYPRHFLWHFACYGGGVRRGGGGPERTWAIAMPPGCICNHTLLTDSGPSFAREIAMNQATAVVIASDDSCLANDMAKVRLVGCVSCDVSSSEATTNQSLRL